MSDEQQPGFRTLISAICFRLVHGARKAKPDFEIAKLSLNPGDLLVVKSRNHLTQGQAEDLRKMLADRLPKGVQTIVLCKDFHLSVLAAQHSNVRSAA